MVDGEADKPTAKEVLVFDSSTFINEAGLTSRGASALRHYLYVRGTQLAVPQVVADECERNLSERVAAKVKSVHDTLEWLARFCGGVSGWTPPQDADVAERVRSAARGEAFDAVTIEEKPSLRQRAEERRLAERPPSHRKDSLQDCRIWEQCLDLLNEHDVIFVSRDRDFRGRRHSEDLHPQLRSEADAKAGGHLTFHPDMGSLLSDLRSDMPQLPAEKVLAFVYDAAAEEVAELETHSGGWQPTLGATVNQQVFTTDQADVVEVRLKVNDRFESAEGAEALEFRLSGSCHYYLSDRELRDLSLTRIGLYMRQPDGTERAVRGSRVRASGLAGGRSVKPEAVEIEFATK